MGVYERGAVSRAYQDYLVALTTEVHENIQDTAVENYVRNYLSGNVSTGTPPSDTKPPVTDDNHHNPTTTTTYNGSGSGITGNHVHDDNSKSDLQKQLLAALLAADDDDDGKSSTRGNHNFQGHTGFGANPFNSGAHPLSNTPPIASQYPHGVHDDALKDHEKHHEHHHGHKHHHHDKDHEKNTPVVVDSNPINHKDQDHTHNRDHDHDNIHDRDHDHDHDSHTPVTDLVIGGKRRHFSSPALASFASHVGVPDDQGRYPRLADVANKYGFAFPRTGDPGSPVDIGRLTPGDVVVAANDTVGVYLGGDDVMCENGAVKSVSIVSNFDGQDSQGVHQGWFALQPVPAAHNNGGGVVDPQPYVPPTAPPVNDNKPRSGSSILQSILGN